MQQWTEGAQRALRDYLNRLREALGEDVETAEIVADVEGHIREEARHLDSSVITAEEVDMILGHVGTPESVASQRRTEPAAEPAAARRGSRFFEKFRAGLTCLFLLVFPLAAIIIGLTSPEFMAEVAIDTFPSVMHPVLCTLAVLCVWFSRFGLKKGSRRRWVPGVFASGVAIGVSFFYAVVLVPLVPLLLMGVIVGVGLIGLAPYWLLIASIRQVVAYGARSGGAGIPGKVALGVLLAAGIAGPMFYLVGYEVLSLDMLQALDKAAVYEGPESAEAVEFLRLHADKEVMRRRCYHLSDRSRPTLLSFLLVMRRPNYISLHKYRTMFFRIYGEPFNAKPIERLRFGFTSRSRVEWQEEWQADAVAVQEQGSTRVGGRVRMLRLKESVVDAFVDSEAAVAYLRWTITIANESQRPREARMKLDVPLNAAVHQMSLWINGQERPAAFGSTATVRKAYTDVVRQKRDPALLTAKGQGKLMFQLFPVPAEGEMKARVGFVIPLVERGGRQYLSLPRIIERNFRISNAVPHTVWVQWHMRQGPQTVAAPWKISTRTDELLTLKADLTDAQLLSYTTSTLSMPHAVPGEGHWSTSTDDRGPVTQYRAPLRVGAGAAWAPGGPVMLVLDGSASCPSLDARPG